MIGQEENHFCFNLTIRRAAGLVGVATSVLSIGLIVKATFEFLAFDSDVDSLCAPIKNYLKSSCTQILKTAWLISLMSLVDSSMVFISSLFLLCGVLKEMPWLLVPYMMWIKMTLSIHAVLCIFLATTYQMDEIGKLILLNIFLILVHLFCAHIVRNYDDVLMKNIFSHSEGIIS